MIAYCDGACFVNPGDPGNERADQLATIGALRAAGVTRPIADLLAESHSCKHFVRPSGCRAAWRSAAFQRSPAGACGPDQRHHEGLGT